MKAFATSASFGGIDDLELELTAPTVELNQANAAADGVVVDFAADPIHYGMTIGGAPNRFCWDGELLQAEATATLNAFGVFRLRGRWPWSNGKAGVGNLSGGLMASVL